MNLKVPMAARPMLPASGAKVTMRILSTTPPPDIQKAHNYCESQLSQGDRNSLLVSKFFAPVPRNLYMALRTLNLELLRMPEIVHTPQLRDLRTSFWIDSIKETFSGNPPREPICLLLHHTLSILRSDNYDSESMLKFWITRLIKARGDLAHNRPIPSLATAEESAEKTYAGIMYSALSACGVSNGTGDHLASHIGKAVGLVAILRGIPVLASGPSQRERSLLLPLDIMGNHGVRESEVFRMFGKARGLRDVVFDVATRANDHLTIARQMITSLKSGASDGHDCDFDDPQKTPVEEINKIITWKNLRRGWPVYLEGVAAGEYLEGLEKVDFDPFLMGASWKTPWRVWRASRKEMI